MRIEERARHELHTRMADVLGPNEAATLMGYLPPVGWADVATKHDLDVVRGDVASLRREVVEVVRHVDGLRDEVHRVSDELHRVRDELRGEIRDLRADSTTMLRTFMLATVTSVLTTASLAFAAARFA